MRVSCIYNHIIMKSMVLVREAHEFRNLPKCVYWILLLQQYILCGLMRISVSHACIFKKAMVLVRKAHKFRNFTEGLNPKP